jgi:glycerol-3-phosphate O-acyltransferase
MFRADATFEENFAETLDDMIRKGELGHGSRGEISLGAGREGLDGAGWIGFYASLMRTFLEGYRVAARGLLLLLKGPLAQKDLVKRTLLAGERMYLAGEIVRREAVSRPLVENALLAFADQGYVTTSQNKVALTDSFATAAAVGAIEGRIGAYAASEVPR